MLEWRSMHTGICVGVDQHARVFLFSTHVLMKYRKPVLNTFIKCVSKKPIHINNFGIPIRTNPHLNDIVRYLKYFWLL